MLEQLAWSYVYRFPIPWPTTQIVHCMELVSSVPFGWPHGLSSEANLIVNTILLSLSVVYWLCYDIVNYFLWIGNSIDCLFSYDIQLIVIYFSSLLVKFWCCWIAWPNTLLQCVHLLDLMVHLCGLCPPNVLDNKWILYALVILLLSFSWPK